MDQPDESVAVDLTEMERSMLRIGLSDWGGPASCDDPLAQALGFGDVDALHEEGTRLADAIARGEPLSRRNWTRALASLEVMLGSVLGSGEWGAVHGYDEDDLYVALKALRRKLPTSRGDLRARGGGRDPDHASTPSGRVADPPPTGPARWFAYPPEGRPTAVDGDSGEGPREGSVVRLMGQNGVDVPLWGEDGLVFVDPAELRREWDLSGDLVARLVTWALDWERRAGEPEHDADAAQLVRQLNRELSDRFTFVFQP